MILDYYLKKLGINDSSHNFIFATTLGKKTFKSTKELGFSYPIFRIYECNRCKSQIKLEFEYMRDYTFKKAYDFPVNFKIKFNKYNLLIKICEFFWFALPNEKFSSQRASSFLNCNKAIMHRACK